MMGIANFQSHWRTGGASRLVTRCGVEIVYYSSHRPVRTSLSDRRVAGTLLDQLRAFAVISPIGCRLDNTGTADASSRPGSGYALLPAPIQVKTLSNSWRGSFQIDVVSEHCLNCWISEAGWSSAAPTVGVFTDLTTSFGVNCHAR